MQYAEKYQDIERSGFDLQFWLKRLEDAKAYREACGWEQAALEGDRIRKNDLPLRGMQGAPEWKGKFFKDNWLWKGIKWLVSMQTGSVIDIDVKGFDYTESMSKDLLEQELNLAIARFDLLENDEETLYDRYYNGFGCVRGVWNTKRIEPQYQTGCPHFDYISPKNIYLDPATRRKYKMDSRYIFHVEMYDIEELKRMYPKYARMITETVTDLASYTEKLDMVEVVTVQYRKTITMEKVFIENQDTGVVKEYLAEEWEEFTAQMAQDPAARQMYDASEQEMSYPAWIDAGQFLPEAVVKLGPFETEEPAIFQAMFIPQLNILLEAPQYAGTKYSYFFLVGYHDPNCAYPFGLAYYMKDLLEASVVLMTLLMITATKMYKNEKLIQSGSLTNQKEYMEKGYQLGVNPVVDEAWQKAHPGVKAVENIPLAEFPAAITMLNDYLINAQKTMSGAVDSAIGLGASGDSGVKVAQLQMASRIYQKEDLDGFNRFILDGATWTKDQIIQFRNYPHKIPGLTQENIMGIVDVATDDTNRLDADTYYVEVTIQENHETVKQIEREMMDNLNNKGYVGGIDLMRSLDISSPEKKYEQAQIERGDKEVIDAVNAHPELRQIIAQFIAQAGAGETTANAQ